MMDIKRIVDLIRIGHDDNNVISFKSFDIITSDIEEIINYLYDKSCVTSGLYDNVKVGDVHSFSISWQELHPLHIYRTKQEFIRANQNYKEDEYYIKEIDCFHDSKNEFILTYYAIQRFRKCLQKVSKHTFKESTIEHIVLSNTQQSVVVKLSFDANNINANYEEVIVNCSNTLDESNEKQKLFIAEFLNYFIEKKSNLFSDLLDNIESVYTNCISAYEFYLSNYSANKFRFEIDSKAIEYTTKLQGVINDSQTKLIAIPTAFVLAASSLDFAVDSTILGVKNLSIVFGLIIFAILLQLFLCNQYDILKYISDNIEEFKASFDKDSINVINERFDKVQKTRKKQQIRIAVANIVVWLVPILLIGIIIIQSIKYYIWL